jgi:hypothetical protein
MNLSATQEDVAPLRLYDHVGRQVQDLVASFGLKTQAAQVLRAYRLIAEDALAVPLGERPPDFSRINDDGTPFQLATAIGRDGASFQFLGEPADLSRLSIYDRLLHSRMVLLHLARHFDLQDRLEQLGALIDRMLPQEDPALLHDHGGTLWIGTGFAAGAAPQLKLYFNLNLGPLQHRWQRTAAFADLLGRRDSWEALRSELTDELQPLGAAVSVRRGRPPTGRIYLSAYGQPLQRYAELAGRCAGLSFRDSFERYMRTLLGAQHAHPTRSAVCSFGFDSTEDLAGGDGADTECDFKLELCAHCLYDSDADACRHSIDALAQLGLSAAPYLQLLRTVAGTDPPDVLAERAVSRHAYLGLGSRRKQAYASFYFKPDIARS